MKTPHNQTLLLGTRWGHMIGLACDPYQTAALGLYGEWAKEECALICSLLKPGDVALDIGANIGSLTIPMAKRVGPAGFVYAFEPQQSPFCCLCGNIALTHCLSSVRALNAAVSDFDGTIQVPIVDVNKPFNVGGVRLADADYDAKSGLQKEEVPCLKIDSLKLDRVDLMKIDVECMESKVLAGAAETIDRCRPAIVAEALVGDANGIEYANTAAMLQFLADHRYDVKLVKIPLFSKDNVRYCTDDIFPGFDQNIIAIHKDAVKPDWFNLLVTPTL